MAEAHPVGFQWVMEAKARGAKIIHVDPRFTRTSAVADLHVPFRAGADIAFLGGLINYVLTEGKDFREYVTTFTNAADLVGEDFVDTEDMAGIFSGYNADTGRYDPISWQLEGVEYEAPAAGMRDHWESDLREQPTGRARATRAGSASTTPRWRRTPVAGPATPPTPPAPRSATRPCSTRAASTRCSSGTTPATRPRPSPGCAAWASRSSCRSPGRSRRTRGRDRTTAWVYSVGWTHHSVGAQYIRGAAILQTLLGNMGRPGGGILALRGHASIQGSTDIPTLYDILPGYIPMPNAHLHDDLRSFLDADAAKTGFWGNMDAYLVSLLKAWWGDAATAENDWAFDYMPRLTGDHGTYGIVRDQIDKKTYGYFVVGENPAVGHANGKMQRLGLANLEWLVVRDMQMIETATFWKDGPEIETEELRTEDIGTEVFFLPCANHTEKAGTFTNTQRLLQWRREAVHPPGDARSELHFYFHLGKKIREKLAGSTDERDRPLLDLTWDYPTFGVHEEPDPESVLGEINGYDADGNPLSSYTQLKADGSTTRGVLDLHRGVRGRRQPGRPSQARLRAGLGGRRVGLGVAGEPPHALQPRLGRRRGQAVERAQGLRLVGRRAGDVDGARHPGLRGDQAAVVRPRRGRDAAGRPVRHRRVHHAGRRQGVALRAGRAGGRADADALRAGRVARWRTCCTTSRTTPRSSASTGPGTGSTPRRARSIPTCS